VGIAWWHIVLACVGHEGWRGGATPELGDDRTCMVVTDSRFWVALEGEDRIGGL